MLRKQNRVWAATNFYRFFFRITECSWSPVLTFKAALKLSAYACTVLSSWHKPNFIAQATEKCYFHTLQSDEEKLGPYLLNLWNYGEMSEKVHFPNRVFTSLHCLVKEKQRNIGNSRIWQDRLKENQVLYCSRITEWAAFSVAMNELLLLNLVKAQTAIAATSYHGNRLDRYSLLVFHFSPNSVMITCATSHYLLFHSYLSPEFNCRIKDVAL